MGKADREKLRAEIDEAANIKQGGYSPPRLAAILTKAVLQLDESSERLSKVNIALTVVIAILTLVQVIMLFVHH